jgi:tetratricopeptide (TPR) repeat protein
MTARIIRFIKPMKEETGSIRHKIAGVVMCTFVLLSCSKSPQEKEAWFLKEGAQAVARKDYPAAIVHFRNAGASMPRRAEPYYQLGRAYAAMGDFAQAAGCYRKAVEVEPSHAGAQFELAELMSRSRGSGHLEEAQARARDLVALRPGDVDALNLLAYTELRLGKTESAESHLQEALRKSPGHVKAAVTIAKTRLARNDVKGAEAALRDAVSKAPEKPEAASYLGGFYLAQGRTKDAEREFDRALRVDPKFGPALLSLAAIQVRTGRQREAEETYRALAALPEKRFRAIHALFLFQTGRRPEAVLELERLFGEEPGDRAARGRLVDAYLAAGRVPEAEKVLAGALEKNPRDGDALLQRGRMYLGMGKYGEAESDLTQACSLGTSLAESHYLLSKLHLARGQAARRRHELGEALRLEPAFLAARVELAQALLAEQGAQSALNLLAGAPAGQGTAAALIVQRNWALLALGRTAEARAGVEGVLAATRVPDALLQDGILKMGRKDYAGARAVANEILAGHPEDVRALRLLMDGYAAARQLPAGLERLKEHAARLPGSAAVQQFLGETLLASGDTAGARRALEASRGNRSGAAAAEMALAELDLSEGKRQDAHRRASALVAAQPGNIAARIMLGRLEALYGERAPAIAQYRKVLDLDARNAVALNNLAFLLADGGEADEALRYAQLAKELEPENPAVDDTLGWVYFRKGIYSAAIRHLEEAVSAETNARRKYHLAMAYLKAGDRQRGRQTLEGALQLDATLPEAETARQLLLDASR